ncbi:hypothetical protein Tco_0248955 [Tanacetum coccineum]
MASMGSSPFWNTGTIRPESCWENSDCWLDIPIEGWMMMENKRCEMDILKLVVEVECFGKCVDEFDKVTVLFGEMQLKLEDRSYVHASNELHLHVVHVVPSKHEADQHW